MSLYKQNDFLFILDQNMRRQLPIANGQEQKKKHSC